MSKPMMSEESVGVTTTVGVTTRTRKRILVKTKPAKPKANKNWTKVGQQEKTTHRKG